MQKLWTQEEVEIASEMYKTKEAKEISKVIGRNENAIRTKMQKLGIKKEDKFNKHYFDIINSADKAYWIGFIWSDGSVIHRWRSKTQEEYDFKLSLKDSDYEHLEKLNKCLDGRYKINFYDSSSTFGKFIECRLLIVNNYFGKILEEKYGIFSYRTDASKLINSIPKEYAKDFIRGLLDADGSFSGNKDNNFLLRFGAGEDILDYINDILIEYNLISNNKIKHVKRHEDRDGNYFQITIHRRREFIDVLDWLYQDSNIYLNRKYEKYLKIRGNYFENRTTI